MTGVASSLVCVAGEAVTFKLPQIDCDFDPPGTSERDKKPSWDREVSRSP